MDHLPQTRERRELRPEHSLDRVEVARFCPKYPQHCIGGHVIDAARSQFVSHTGHADLVELVNCDKHTVMLRFVNLEGFKQCRQKPPIVQSDHKLIEPDLCEHLADRRELLHFDER